MKLSLATGRVATCGLVAAAVALAGPAAAYSTRHHGRHLHRYPPAAVGQAQAYQRLPMTHGLSPPMDNCINPNVVSVSQCDRLSAGGRR